MGYEGGSWDGILGWSLGMESWDGILRYIVSRMGVVNKFPEYVAKKKVGVNTMALTQMVRTAIP